jgi:hypothetical protein
VSHKGDRRLTELREKLVYAAIRILFHRQAEVARFLEVSACTLSFCLRRFSKKLQATPLLEDTLIQWLRENSKIKKSGTLTCTLKVSDLSVNPACMAGVRTSRPKFKAR